MRHSLTLLAVAAAFATALIDPAHSQGAPQTVTLMKVDLATLATGYRASKLIGSSVVNEGRRDGRHDRRSRSYPRGQAP